MKEIPKELQTQELKQELYREWVDTYYNGAGKHNSVLTTLITIAVSLLSLSVVTLSFIKSNHLDNDIYMFSSRIFAVVIIGLVCYIIYDFFDKKSKLLIITEDIKQLDKISKMRISCKGGEVNFTC